MLKGMARNTVYYAMLLIMAFLFAFPVLYMLTNSFMSSAEVSRTYDVISGGVSDKAGQPVTIGFTLIPDRVTLMQYYNVLLRKPKYLLMFWNSIIVTVPVVAGQTLVASLAAFAFAKLRFPFRDKIFFLYIIIMMMPFQVTLVPNYIMLSRLDLLGNYWAIILPGIFSAFGVFLMRQFMMLIPDEYCEAAKIDGAGFFRTFCGIILPQCKGAIASVAVLIFVDNWNMVEQPLIFLRDENMHPLSIFLARINSGDIGIAFACGFLYMLPAILIFLYGENYLIEGIQLSGLK